ncbi:hypothetical protein GM182_03390 [bacterium 3DAC]|nr:flagellar protein FlaG [Dictyoglomota bacterium]UZN22954.1 hypothetical protein GM182_03390 [bacterium 3DAC]
MAGRDFIEGISGVERADFETPSRGVGEVMQLYSLGDRLVKEASRYNAYLDANQTKPLTKEDVENMVDRIKKILETLDASVDVKIKHYKEIPDLILGMQIVFEDKRTKKVIKEIPPEKLLRLYKELLEKIGFFLLDKEV